MLFVAGLGLAAGACDTGDGTTLRDPTAPTTLPPPDTAPLPSQPIGEAGVGSVPPFESVLAAPETGGAIGQQPVAGFEIQMPWEDGTEIDLRYTCDGSNAAPAISWAGVPDGTVELAVAMVNESDLTSGRPFIQWVMTGIDPASNGLGENEVPPGAVEGINFFGDIGYTGPCPDPGTRNTYTFTVLALAQQLEIAEETPAAQILDTITTVSIGTASNTANVAR